MTTTIMAAVSAHGIDIGLNANGCGHVIVLTKEHYEACLETHRPWYCTICGAQRMFVGKTTLDLLRGELASAKQEAETLRAQRNETEQKLRRERKRIVKGVCPCCKRTVSQMARHMATKHPDYVKAST